MGWVFGQRSTKCVEARDIFGPRQNPPAVDPCHIPYGSRRRLDVP
jgi:hypothetical protein